jgi:hypothetical protein
MAKSAKDSFAYFWFVKLSLIAALVAVLGAAVIWLAN